MSHQFKQTKKYFKGLRRAQGDHGGTTSTGNSQNMAKEGQKELLFARKRRVTLHFSEVVADLTFPFYRCLKWLIMVHRLIKRENRIL